MGENGAFESHAAMSDRRRIFGFILLGSVSTFLSTSGLGLLRGAPIYDAALAGTACAIWGSVAWICYHTICGRYDGLAIFIMSAIMLDHERRSFLESSTHAVIFLIPTASVVGLLTRGNRAARGNRMAVPEVDRLPS